MLFEDTFQTVAGAKSAHFDIALAPTGEGGDFLHAALFQLAQGEDELFVRGELAHGPGEQLPRASRGDRLLDARILEIEIDRFEGDLRADPALLAQKIVTDGDGDSCEPMFERGIAPELREILENPEKDFLSEIIELM